MPPATNSGQMNHSINANKLPISIKLLFSVLTRQNYKQALQQKLIYNLQSSLCFRSASEYSNIFQAFLENEAFTQLKHTQKAAVQQFQKYQSTPLEFLFYVSSSSDKIVEFDVTEKITISLSSKQQSWKRLHPDKYLEFICADRFFVSLIFKRKDQFSCFLGIVERQKPKNSRESKPYQGKLYLPTSQKIIAIIELLEQSKFDHQWQDCYLQPLNSPATYIAELNSLQNLPYSPIKNYILGNEIQPLKNLGLQNQQANLFEMILRNKNYKNYMNDSQITVVRDAFNHKNLFTLVQGPPGTGKTQTILGIVSALLRLDFQETDQVLLLCKSNHVANDLTRKLVNSYSSEVSILNFSDEHPLKINLKIRRAGSGKRSEPDIYSQTLEILAQNDFFNRKFSRLKQDLKDRLLQDFKLPQDQISTAVILDKILQFKNDGIQNLECYYQVYLSLLELCNSCRDEYIRISNQHLRNSHIIVSTLNSCRSTQLFDYLTDGRKIRMCLIDEAPTALEPTILIPLVNYQIEKFVLLGDLKQLKPLTYSQVSQQYHYNRSFYERVAMLYNQPILLNQQYRSISELTQIIPYFYPKIQPTNNNKDFPQHVEYLLNRQNCNIFFDSIEGKEQKSESSFYNKLEACAIVKLVAYLTKESKSPEGTTQNRLESKNQKRISIICGYKEQVNCIKQKLKRKKLMHHVEIDTIDAFQGKENEIIIVSLVRTEKVGFLSNKNRINVALSRAIYAQFVFGCKTILKNILLWNKILKKYTQQNNVRNYTSQDINSDNFFQNHLQL